MFQSLVLSIICIIWGFILIIQARMEMKQSQNPKQKQKAEEKEDKFSGRTLYFSNVPLREMEECCLRKQGIFEDMNVIERAECKTAIYWIIRFIDKIFLEDAKGFFTEEGKKRLMASNRLFFFLFLNYSSTLLINRKRSNAVSFNLRIRKLPK